MRVEEPPAAAEVGVESREVRVARERGRELLNEPKQEKIGEGDKKES